MSRWRGGGRDEKRLPATLLARLAPHEPVIKFVTVGELTKWAFARDTDSWIAACCLAYDLPLAMLNLLGFQDFADYEGLVLISE